MLQRMSAAIEADSTYDAANLAADRVDFAAINPRDLTPLLDKVCAFLRTARWRARNRSGTAAATILLDEVYVGFTIRPHHRTCRRLRAWPGSGGGGARGDIWNLLLLRAWPGGGGEGVHSWTGHLLSTPLAADFGPGSEAAAEGSSAGRGVCFVRLSLPTSGLALRGRRRGAQVDGEFALHASRRRLTSGLARRGRRRGGLRDGESAVFIVSRCRSLLRACPGADGEGAYGQRVCTLAPLATDFGRRSRPEHGNEGLGNKETAANPRQNRNESGTKDEASEDRRSGEDRLAIAVTLPGSKTGAKGEITSGESKSFLSATYVPDSQAIVAVTSTTVNVKLLPPCSTETSSRFPVGFR